MTEKSILCCTRSDGQFYQHFSGNRLLAICRCEST